MSDPAAPEEKSAPEWLGRRGKRKADPLAMPRGIRFPHLINIGFGHLVLTSRIVGVFDLQASNAVKGYVEGLRQTGGAFFIDATVNRKRRAFLVLDSGHIVLSSLSIDKLRMLIVCDMAGQWGHWTRQAKDSRFVFSPAEVLAKWREKHSVHGILQQEEPEETA